MTKDEALKLALEALSSGVKTKANRIEWLEYDSFLIKQAINAIKEALAQEPLEQKPLSELEKDAVNLLFALHDAWPYVHRHCTIESNRKAIQALIVKHGEFADIHTSPPQRKPLTDGQIIEWVESGEYNVITNDWASHIAFARVIESAHGIKE